MKTNETKIFDVYRTHIHTQHTMSNILKLKGHLVIVSGTKEFGKPGKPVGIWRVSVFLIHWWHVWWHFWWHFWHVWHAAHRSAFCGLPFGWTLSRPCLPHSWDPTRCRSDCGPKTMQNSSEFYHESIMNLSWIHEFMNLCPQKQLETIKETLNEKNEAWKTCWKHIMDVLVAASGKKSCQHRRKQNPTWHLTPQLHSEKTLQN